MNSSDQKASVTSISAAKKNQQPSSDVLSEANNLVSAEIDSVNTEIRSQLNSDIALINTLGEYIIQSGGKRLRPLILLLSARALNYTGQQHISLAAVIEFIHTATLLHDDVVDASTMRRGNQTANDIWGNEASVLVGDFLYSRAFEMMVSVDSMPVMDVMARTTNTIAEGEVMQLLNAHDAYTSEQAYLETIYRKTACLFESAAELGGLISGAGKAQIEALQTYGKALGNAFQIMDDMLDYQSDSSVMGKNSGDDLSEGKTTLPLIEAMKRGSNEQQAIIIDAIENGKREQLAAILKIVGDTGSLDYSYQVALGEVKAAQRALELLPETPYRKALYELADFSIKRKY
ncbi:MAG: octaprenyl-diphosphate synthase [Saprospiraceae bacterium]|jgi:octaprenyl-diphosphate synthase